ncbi:MAG: NOB1 family endonuclease [Candidatus Hydrothermarchaeota archaeon]
METIYILDSSVFFSDLPINLLSGKKITVPEVEEELRDDKRRLKLQIVRDLEIRKPNERFIQEVTEVSKKTGDIRFLSETDISILALALEIKKDKLYPIILTDDYDIQNLSMELGIEYKKVARKGIKEVFRWYNVCEGCGKIYDITYDGECEVCGSMLRKKVRKGTRRYRCEKS